MSEPSTSWDFVSRSKYETPGFSTEAVRTLHGAWKKLRKRAAAWRDRSEEAHGELERPAELPAGLVPEFDVEAAAHGLLEEWERRRTASGMPQRLLAVVGPPGTRVDEIVAEVAKLQDWPVIESPNRRELFEGSETLEDKLETLRRPDESAAVLPRLEDWFLRRAAAMAGIRAVVHTLAESGTAMVGCNSWTWAFLQRTIGIEEALAEPVTLAPFDGSKLDQWLGEPFRSQQLICMRSGSSDSVFSDPDNKKQSESSGKSHSLLNQLASAARGNPGVALAVWKRSLREDDDQAAEESSVAVERERSWWSVPPEEAELDLVQDADDLHRFVLHACLVHGGLELDLLQEGLPFPDHEVARRVSHLKSANLLVEHNQRIEVSLDAYIAVRRDLVNRGFVADVL